MRSTRNRQRNSNCLNSLCYSEIQNLNDIGSCFCQTEKKGGRDKQRGHNSNFWDLGYSNEMTDQAEINSTVAAILKKFDLIMISDYMDESLILLRHELGWNMEDILYFTINKRLDQLLL